MSLLILNELQKEADTLRRTAATLRSRAEWVASKRKDAQRNPTLYSPFEVRSSYEDRSQNPNRTNEVEAAFHEAIAPLQDHILATMEEGFLAGTKKAMMLAEAIEGRIAASITLPATLPQDQP